MTKKERILEYYQELIHCVDESEKIYLNEMINQIEKELKKNKGK